MPLGTEVGLGPADIVLGEDPAPKKVGTAGHPSFRPMYCDQTAGQIMMPLGREVNLGPGHIMLEEDPAPPPPKKKGAQPHAHFLAHVYCGDTVAHLSYC